MNYIYPNGSSCMTISNHVYDFDATVTQKLVRLGVDFVVLESETSKKHARGINKVFSCCRVITPENETIIVANMKRWVSMTFNESYGWVMMNIKREEGYKGYRAEKLFSISVTASQVGRFSAIPLDQQPGHPWLKIDEWEA